MAKGGIVSLVTTLGIRSFGQTDLQIPSGCMYPYIEVWIPIYPLHQTPNHQLRDTCNIPDQDFLKEFRAARCQVGLEALQQHLVPIQGHGRPEKSAQLEHDMWRSDRFASGVWFLSIHPLTHPKTKPNHKHTTFKEGTFITRGAKPGWSLYFGHLCPAALRFWFLQAIPAPIENRAVV